MVSTTLPGADPFAEELFEVHRPWLKAFLTAATGDVHLADDLVQQAFLAAIAKRAEFDRSRSFGAWLRGIARNELRRERDRHARRPVTLKESALDAIGGDFDRTFREDQTLSFWEDRLEALHVCLGKLSAVARKALSFRYRNGMSSREISGRIGRTPGSVDVLLCRSRSSLAECIKRKVSRGEA